MSDASEGLIPTLTAALLLSGYAEVVNAGKSKTSEDQAICLEKELEYGLKEIFQNLERAWTECQLMREVAKVFAHTPS